MGVYDGLIDINLLERFWNNAKQHMPSGGGVPLFDDYDTNLWTIGSLTSANGTNYTSTTRIRTELLSLGIIKVKPLSGYKIAVYVYNASGVYQGIWNGTAPVTSTVTWFTDAVDLRDLPSGSQVRVIAADTSDSTITTSTQDTFAQGVILTRYTDDSLSHSGHPADAYATGQGFYRGKDRKLHTPAALTYWDITEVYSSGCTPANVPVNTYTETSGARISGFSGLSLSSTSVYLLFCFVSFHTTSARWYILIGRATRECYIGRSTNSGSTVGWIDFSPGAKTDSITTTTSWSGNGPYTQTVTLTNGSPTSNSKIDIQPNAAAIAQLMADGVKALYIENNAGTLTAYAVGAAPTAALTLQVTVTEVTA